LGLVNELIVNNERAGQTFNKTWVKAKLFKTKLQQRQHHCGSGGPRNDRYNFKTTRNELQATSRQLPAKYWA
jgi:hypothetical protein